MADERIEVEWIATATRMTQVLDRLESKFDKQEKQLEDIARTSKKTAEAAAGSFNAIEQELKQAEAAMKGMTQGTAAFAAQKAKVDALRDSLKNAKGQMQAAGGGFGAALQGGVGQIKSMVAGMVTLQAVVTAITSELAKVEQLRAAAAQQTRTFEQAVNDMILNIGAEQAPVARQMILQQAPQLGVDPAGLAQLIGSAISGGATDLKEAMQLSSDVLAVTAGDMQKAMPLMSGMLTISAATQNRDFKAIMGQLTQFQAAGRGGDMAQTIQNMSSAFAAVNTQGERLQALGAERTLELAATISQILQDERGATTGTTLRQLMQRMDIFVAKREMKLDDGSVSRLTQAQVDGFNKLGTLDERLAAMRADNAIARQFMSTIENNEGTAAIRQLAFGDKNAIELEKRSAELVGNAAQGQQEYTKLVDTVANETRMTRVKAKSEAQAAVGEITGGRAPGGTVQGVLETIFKSVNLPGIDLIQQQTTRAEILAREQAGYSPEQAAIDTLRGSLLGGAAGMAARGNLPGFMMGGLSPEDRAQVEAQIKILEDMRDAMQAAAKAPVKVQAPPMRPKEAPLPAATAP